MFYQRLHPTPIGLAFGILVIALWALLWTWFLAQVPTPRAAHAQVPAAEVGAQLLGAATGG